MQEEGPEVEKKVLLQEGKQYTGEVRMGEAGPEVEQNVLLQRNKQYR